MAEYSRNRDGANIGINSGKGDWHGQPKAGISNIFYNLKYRDGEPQID